MKKKKYPKLHFFIFIFCCGLVGGIIGFLQKSNEEAFMNFIMRIKEVVILLSPWLTIGILLAAGGLGLIFNNRAKKVLDVWNEEDEAAAERFDRLMNTANGCITVSTILAIMFFAFSIMSLLEWELWFLAFYTLFFIIGEISLVFIQRAGIELQKKMNPEKQGDVLSLHFQKEWLESCDERERMIVYQASFKSYQHLQIGFSAAFFLAFTAGIFTSGSLLPVALVCGLWLLQTLSYFIECSKLERKKLKIKSGKDKV